MKVHMSSAMPHQSNMTYLKKSFTQTTSLKAQNSSRTTLLIVPRPLSCKSTKNLSYLWSKRVRTAHSSMFCLLGTTKHLTSTKWWTWHRATTPSLLTNRTRAFRIKWWTQPSRALSETSSHTTKTVAKTGTTIVARTCLKATCNTFSRSKGNSLRSSTSVCRSSSRLSCSSTSSQLRKHRSYMSSKRKSIPFSIKVIKLGWN